MEWKPISTAPTDGRAVLLLGMTHGCVCCQLAGYASGELWEEQNFDSEEDAAGWWAREVTGECKIGFVPVFWCEIDLVAAAALVRTIPFEERSFPNNGGLTPLPMLRVK